MKTVWRKPQGFESLPLRHNEKVVLVCGLFRSGDGRLIRTLLHCGSNGYDDAARCRRVLNPFLSALTQRVALVCGLFRSGDGRLIRTLLHCGSNGYGRMQWDCRSPNGEIPLQRSSGSVASVELFLEQRLRGMVTENFSRERVHQVGKRKYVVRAVGGYSDGPFRIGCGDSILP